MTTPKKIRVPANITEWVVNAVAHRARRDGAAKQYDRVQTALLPWFQSTFAGQTDDRTIITHTPEMTITSTLVTPTKNEVDTTGLRKSIGEAAWRKLLTPTFDPDKFVKAIQEGRISQEIADRFTYEVETKPYVKHTTGPVAK